MKIQIKSIFLTLFPSKKSFLLSFFIFTMLTALLFPYDDVIQKLTYKLSSASPSTQLQYDSHLLGVFPPRLILKQAELINPWTAGSASFDRLDIAPAYLSFFTLRPGVILTAYKEKSKLDVLLKTSFFSSKNKTSSVEIRAESKGFEIKHFHLLSPFFNNSQGLVDFFLNLKMDMGGASKVKGSIQMRAKDLFFNSYSFSQAIGTWTLPQLKWKSLEGKASLDKGRLNIQNLRIGEMSDPLYLQSKGFVNVKFGALQMVREYNLEMDLLLDEAMKNQFFFLDLFLSNVEEKVGENRSQYKAKITGRSSYPPKIEKL